MKSIFFTPHALHETSRGIDRIPLQDEMLSRREVMLVGEMDAEMVNSLIMQLLHLKREDAQADITMFVNSPGGEVDSGLALYDVMRGISCPVRTVCTGLAASMASVIFAAGDTREMLPHGRLMLHDPLLSSVGGSALSVNSIAEDLMKTREQVARVYAEHTGKTLQEIFDITSKDTFFSAEDAVEFGLADRIIKEV